MSEGARADTTRRAPVRILVAVAAQALVVGVLRALAERASSEVANLGWSSSLQRADEALLSTGVWSVALSAFLLAADRGAGLVRRSVGWLVVLAIAAGVASAGAALVANANLGYVRALRVGATLETSFGQALLSLRSDSAWIDAATLSIPTALAILFTGAAPPGPTRERIRSAGLLAAGACATATSLVLGNHLEWVASGGLFYTGRGLMADLVAVILSLRPFAFLRDEAPS